VAPMRLLVTGGAGFIGSNFVRMALSGRLSDISHITVLDKLTYAGLQSNLSEVANSPNYQFILGDICDPILVSELLLDVDAVINFAAESHVDRSIESSLEFVQTNVLGVEVLLASIRKTDKNIRFIQISTDEVYGTIEKGSWTEDSPLLPNSPYSASKAGGELIARAYFKTYGTDTLITRSSNNYGRNHFPEKLIPLFVTNLIQGMKVPVYGDGKNIRDWMHVDDNCRGIHRVLMRGKSGEAYNIGGGRELSNIEITHYVLEFLGKNQSSIEYVEDRKGHDFRYSLNWTKASKYLGYKPQVEFENGIQDTIQWYVENESWWKPLKST
jgi:dTDP-glucose 4,6-dehydratase